MKVTYNWLKDFVDIGMKPAALADKLTMAGLEVTALHKHGQDYAFEIEVTSNRPDWLSIIGIAREIAAISGRKLKKLGARSSELGGKTKAGTGSPVFISVESKKDCSLYTATVIKGVKVGPSPGWIIRRLEAVGVRPVNSIVDITNYVLFETGQPLHAFDQGKLSGPDINIRTGYLCADIYVRRAKNGEKLLTLDGQEKALDDQILVIADRGRVIAAAGIMGGKDTEVGPETKDILLEAAVFDPILTRRGRRRLGIQSESSYRFERGVDAGGLEWARGRAAELICRICGGKVISGKSRGSFSKKKKTVDFDLNFARQLTGAPIAAADAVKILGRLGFEVKKKTGRFQIAIPSWRGDVTCEADLIEEIARIWGYDKVPASLPAVRADIGAICSGDPVWALKNILAALGSTEVSTYSLLDRKLLEAFGIDLESLAQIQNPLSLEQELLRPALAPSLARCVAYNLNQKQEYLNLFEIGRVFSAKSRIGAPEEELNLCIALCGEKTVYFESGVIKDKMSLLHLKGMAEAIFQRIGIANYDFRPNNVCGADIYCGNERVGSIGKMQGRALEYLDIKAEDVFIGEFSLGKIFPTAVSAKKIAPLPVYPGMSRDISFIVDSDVRARDILEAIRTNGGLLLEEARVVDYYAGKQIPAGKRSLTVSCFYRLADRTLTESEVAPVHQNLRRQLQERFGAELR